MSRKLFRGGDRRLYMISIPHSAEVISSSILSSASQLCFPCNFHFNIDSDPPPSIGHLLVSITHYRYFNLQTSTSIPTPHSRLIPRLLLHSTYSRNLARHPTSPPGVPDAAICTPNAESACGTAPGTPSRTIPALPSPSNTNSRPQQHHSQTQNQLTEPQHRSQNQHAKQQYQKPQAEGCKSLLSHAALCAPAAATAAERICEATVIAGLGMEMEMGDWAAVAGGGYEVRKKR